MRKTEAGVRGSVFRAQGRLAIYERRRRKEGREEEPKTRHRPRARRAPRIAHRSQAEGRPEQRLPRKAVLHLANVAHAGASAGLSRWPGAAQGDGGLRVNVALDPEGVAAGGSQLTASCSEFSGRELRAAHLKAGTRGLTHRSRPACPLRP